MIEALEELTALDQPDVKTFRILNDTFAAEVVDAVGGNRQPNRVMSSCSADK